MAVYRRPSVETDCPGPLRVPCWNLQLRGEDWGLITGREDGKIWLTMHESIRERYGT